MPAKKPATNDATDNASDHVAGQQSLGGVLHTYLKFDPIQFPPPRSEAPDAVGAAFNHMMMYGSMRRFTPEELADAIEIDPASITGLGPSLESLRRMLQERKEKILATFQTDSVREEARKIFHDLAGKIEAPAELEKKFRELVKQEQLRDLEKLWYRVEEKSLFARRLLPLIERLGERYQVESLASKYVFTGAITMNVEKALAIKEELETIDRLLAQIEEAMKNAKVAKIDMEALSRFAQEQDVNDLREIAKRIQEQAKLLAEQQGLEQDGKGFKLSPKAMRIYQSRLLKTIFSSLQAARSGRHEGVLTNDGAVELPSTRAYEFGDSPAAMDIPQTFINALLRERANQSGPRAPGPLRIRSADIEVHRTRRAPKAATAVLMDMSGSMRYGGQYVACKKMALALDGLIRSEYPGDFLQLIEMYSLAKAVAISDVPALMPKMVSINSSVVRLKADLSDPRVTESDLPLHFTNIQRAMQLGRQFLCAQATPNKQIILITDGLPTAHFEGSTLFLLYPPDPRTEKATMREAMLCQREGITINIILLPSWSQTQEDVSFAQRMAQTTGGRVMFAGGEDLDRFVVWDYVNRRRSILG